MSSLVDVNQRIKYGNEGELGEPLVHIIHELSAAIADPALPLQQTLQRGPQLFGQNIPFLTWSPAVVGLRCLGQCRQVLKVDLIWCVVGKCRVRSSLVVERNVCVSSFPGIADALVGVQVHLLVFDALPKPLHEHVVPPAAFSIHADPGPVVLQRARDSRLVNWQPWSVLKMAGVP